MMNKEVRSRPPVGGSSWPGLLIMNAEPELSASSHRGPRTEDWREVFADEQRDSDGTKNCCRDKPRRTGTKKNDQLATESECNIVCEESCMSNDRCPRT